MVNIVFVKNDDVYDWISNSIRDFERYIWEKICSWNVLLWTSSYSILSFVRLSIFLIEIFLSFSFIDAYSSFSLPLPLQIYSNQLIDLLQFEKKTKKKKKKKVICIYDTYTYIIMYVCIYVCTCEVETKKTHVYFYRKSIDLVKWWDTFVWLSCRFFFFVSFFSALSRLNAIQ